jgi:tRNA G46 methylase TrmB
MPRGQAAEIGTERLSPNGYIYRKTDHGWVLVHRLVAEEKLQRKLMPNEYATFVDGDRTNFKPENIIVRLRGRASLRRRLAHVEEQIRELTVTRDELVMRLKLQGTLVGQEDE